MGWIEWVNLGLAVAGMLVAAVQTTRLREIRRRTNADIWVCIQTCGSVVARIEETKLDEANITIAAAHGSGKELFRQLLKLAVIDEKDLTEETIEKWRRSGRLRNDWQELQVRQLLPTDRIENPGKGSTP